VSDLPGSDPGSSGGARAPETFRSGRNALTPQPADLYPGLRVIRPGRWDLSLIVPNPGQTIVALGGEEVLAYETADGGRAEGFVLRAGDRATLAWTGSGARPGRRMEW